MQAQQIGAAASGPSDGQAGIAPANDVGRRSTGDRFLDHYFRRIDPRIAASFSDTQRRAIKTMFAERGVTRHPLDLRRSLPLGRHRFYLVLLAGRERRALRVLREEGLATWTCDFLTYLGLAIVLLAPFLLGAYLFRTWVAGA